MWILPHECLRSTHGKLYISGKVRSSPFQKYIAFHSYFKEIHLVVVRITPILPKFPSTLVPFSLIQNHMMLYLILVRRFLHESPKRHVRSFCSTRRSLKLCYCGKTIHPIEFLREGGHGLSGGFTCMFRLFWVYFTRGKSSLLLIRAI